MILSDQEKLRFRMESFIGRQGQGSVNLLAKESAYTRQYIGQFRGGREAGWQFIKGLNDVLDRLGESDPINFGPLPGYTEENTPVGLLAQELRLIADYLDSPRHSKEMKAMKFSNFLDSSIAGRDEYISLIEELENDTA